MRVFWSLVLGRYLQVCGNKNETAKNILELFNSVLNDTKAPDNLRYSVVTALLASVTAPCDANKVELLALTPSVEAVTAFLQSQASKPAARFVLALKLHHKRRFLSNFVVA